MSGNSLDSPIVINVSDSEATIIDLDRLKREIIKLKKSYRRRSNKRKVEVEKLRDSKKRDKRDHQEDKKLWQQMYADKKEEVDDLKHEMAKLREQVKQLKGDLEDKTNQLERMAGFICAICYDPEISQATRCGHGFCATCLDNWFDTVAKNAKLRKKYRLCVGEAPCPNCREILCQWGDDIWTLYLTKA